MVEMLGSEQVDLSLQWRPSAEPTADPEPDLVPAAVEAATTKPARKSKPAAKRAAKKERSAEAAPADGGPMAEIGALLEKGPLTTMELITMLTSRSKPSIYTALSNMRKAGTIESIEVPDYPYKANKLTAA